MLSRIAVSGLVALTLAGCGAGGASGPIGRACMEGGRQAANPALCSCVQRVADQTLSGAEQRRGARFFSDPQRAQDMRQAGDPASSEAWRRWRAFANRATEVCG